MLSETVFFIPEIFPALKRHGRLCFLSDLLLSPPSPSELLPLCLKTQALHHSSCRQEPAYPGVSEMPAFSVLLLFIFFRSFSLMFPLISLLLSFFFYGSPLSDIVFHQNTEIILCRRHCSMSCRGFWIFRITFRFNSENYLTVTTNFFVINLLLHFTVIVAFYLFIPFTTPFCCLQLQLFIAACICNLPAGARAAFGSDGCCFTFLTLLQKILRLNAGFLTTTL